jgi:hypothetical protein
MTEKCSQILCSFFVAFVIFVVKFGCARKVVIKATPRYPLGSSIRWKHKNFRNSFLSFAV